MPEQTHRIVRAVRTCYAYPAQWDAWTDRGDYLYLRCRHGHATVTLFSGGPDWGWDSPREEIASFLSDPYPMSLAEMCEGAGLVLAEDADVRDVWPDYSAVDYARENVDA